MIWPYSIRHLSTAACARAHTGTYWPDLERCACGLRDWRDAVVRGPPQEVQAVYLACSVSRCPMREYAPAAFARFEFLGKLHLHGASTQRLQPPRMYRKELQL
ncbi:hypothetical protein BC826DRAFT_1065757 [Russula brevipes]|nr:hypothetical protein BC826DRAFT_1065757 [Russula brevipes]